MKKPKKQPKFGTCYLCGTYGEVTDDHVIPEGVFPDPLPPGLPTAPACRECNGGLSKDEEYFRTCILSGMALEHPDGQRLWDTKVKRSFARRPFGLRAVLAASLKPVILESESGQRIGPLPLLEVDRARFDRVIRKIVRGLYYTYFGDILPMDIPFYISVDGLDPAGALRDQVEYWSKLGGATFGNQVVQVRGERAFDAPLTSIWYLLFYKAFTIMASTGINDDDTPYRPSVLLATP